MAALLRRRAVVAAKVEASEGTAESVAVGDAGILVYDPSFETDFDKFDRDPARASLAKLTALIGKQAAKISFRTELKGSGNVANAPSWGVLLRGCGFQQAAVSKINIGAVTGGPFIPGETITGGTSAATGRVVGEAANGIASIWFVVLTGTFQSGEVITGGTSGATATSSSTVSSNVGFEYRPLSSGPPSLTVARYMDGIRQQIFGARGNVKISAQVGEPVFLEFEFMGVYDATTDVAILAPTYETTIPPTFMNVGFSIQGLAAVFSKFDLDMKNTLTPRESANAAKGILSVFIGDRNPGGPIDPELTLVASHDFFGKLAASTTGRMAFTIGSSAGSKIWVASPLAQYEAVGDDDRGGIAVAGVDVGYKSASVQTSDDDVLIAMI